MRPTIQSIFLEIASLLAQRATCQKLQVGAVLVDRELRILATGYNGVPRGLPHCIDSPCPGVGAPKGSDLCEAVHAEQNAILQCKDIDKVDGVFLTHAPCMRCVKMLLNTRCNYVVFSDSSQEEPAARTLWLRANRIWLHAPTPET
jgi:dCMP deaminase